MSEIKTYFQQKKEQIVLFLEDFVKKNGTEYGKVHNLGSDVLERLVVFSKQGKMLRGGLVSLGYELFEEDSQETCLTLGAALELFQSALLIHDDIMDRDIIRRGSPSIYHQYVLKSGEWNLYEPDHAGRALGICAGDIAFFTAFEMISIAELPDVVKTKLFELCARELSYVGVAQMVDVHWGAGVRLPDPEEVLNLYTYKTGRYTFSLPLIMGGIAAGQVPEVIKLFEKFGTALGTIFQLRDDEIGIYGNEKEVGKPIGSDIKEGKKTLFYLYLFERIDSREREKIQTIFGNQSASEEDIRYVKELMEKFDIRQKVASVVSRFAEQAWEEIRKLNGVKGNAKALLEELILYSVQRSK